MSAKAKKSLVYRIVSTFDADQYARSSITPRHWRNFPPTTKGVFAALDQWLLPVYGVPMKARDTFLAQILKESRKFPLSDQNLTDMFNRDPLWRLHDLRERRSRHDDPLRNSHSSQLGNQDRVKQQALLKGKLLGVEIEFYPNCQTARELEQRENNSGLIHFGTDGSLSSGGRELRKLTWSNPRLAWGASRLPGITSLPMAGRIDGACGLHVHVDIRQYSRAEVHSIYNALLHLEPHVKRLIPPSRRRSDWAIWGSNWDTDSRYYAWNAKSIGEHGTIEWRMQAGSNSPLFIEAWALFCQFWTHRIIPMGGCPSDWPTFLLAMPEPLRSWCANRRDALYPRNPFNPLKTDRATAVQASN